MDPVILARIQFALTIGFHYIFPPITIGMAWLIFWLFVKHRRTGDQFFADCARFWIKIFAITFAIGVATGITMEFQFGTNWSEYSRYVGDIFGAPLAAEGILAFFLESTFMGVLIFGWERVSATTRLVASLMVALGSTMSAFWIIVANSWQQTPAGYHIVEGENFTRAELTNFAQAVFNPSTMVRFLHTVDAAFVAGAFFMMGISAWYIIRNRNLRFAKESFRMALIVALISSVVVGVLGHQHAVQVANTQPAKMATFEGLYETQTRAPILLFGIPDAESGKVHASIGIPGLLSLLIYNDPNAEVTGLDAFPRDERPPVTATFWSFHLMVYLGLFFMGLSALGVLLMIRKKLYESKWFMILAIWTLPLPIIANELGWIAAEVGRQPWAVYGLLKTSDAVSISVTSAELIFSIIMFVILYIILFTAWVFLIRRQMKIGPAFVDQSGEVQ